MKQHCDSPFAAREERLVALLQSWKRAHHEMQKRHDPFAEMVAADIAKLAERVAHHQVERPVV
jgi:aminoglycoside phosphotransferase